MVCEHGSPPYIRIHIPIVCTYRCPRARTRPTRHLLTGQRTVAIPDIAGHPPRPVALCLVDRDVLPAVVDGGAAGPGRYGNRVGSPFNGPLSRRAHLVD